MTVERLAKGGPVGLATAGQQGEPLVLLHGFPHDRTLWAPQLAEPISGVRVFAPDLPGFGESARIGAPSVDSWADWLAAVLDHLQLERVVLGGLSMGGYLCFAFWRSHASRVRGLVLADTKAGADGEEARGKRLEMQAMAKAKGAGAVSEAMITGMVSKSTRTQRPDVVGRLDAMMRRASREAIHDALDVLRTRPDSTPTLATIDVPTLIICGEDDALTPVPESRAMHERIPSSRIGIIPKAGHASNMEDPAAFNRLLSSFVTATIRG